MRLRNILCSLVYNHDLGPIGPWVLYFAFKRPTWLASVASHWTDEGGNVFDNPAASLKRSIAPNDLLIRLAAELDLIDQIRSELAPRR